MSRKVIRAGIFAMSLLMLTCSPREQREQLKSKLMALFSRELVADGPGGAMILMKDTTVVFSAATGLADLVTKEEITSHTLFNLGSISKTFVANGILILQAEGKLSVEDSLFKYFPGFKNREIASRVKIKHLLTHTSGLPDNRMVSADSVFYLTANDAQNWYPVTQTDILEFEPGTRYNYSNPAFNALALIIEKVSGKKWQEFIKERILIPSGMRTSTITDGAHPQSGVSHGYTMIAGEWREDDFGEEPTFCAAGNGGVWSSIEELANYELALRKATFLDQSMLADARQVKTFPQWNDSTPPDRGWSWEVVDLGNGIMTAEHTGHQGGFAANYVAIPSKGILFVVLFNAPYDVFKLRDDIVAMLKDEHWLE